MSTRQPARHSGNSSQIDGVSWPRPVLLVGALLCGGVALMSGRPALAAVNAGEDSQNGASESPSDVSAPVAEQPAAEVAKVAKGSCGSQCKVICCRRERLGSRLLRRLRARRCCCCCCVGEPEKTDAAKGADAPEKPDPYAWKVLFDGKTLQGWKAPNFGGEGEVYVEDGKIVMEMGQAMTGVTWTGEVIRDNYELEYEGIRLEGVDFFATVTFPVGKDEASLVTGGWGGTVVGISCIDYYDAGDNLTTTFHDLKDKQWYKFRVRITPAKIEAWIGDEQVVDQQRKDHKIGIRDECDLCRPLGFATYVTTGAVRGIRIRKLKPPADPEESAQQK